MRIEIRIDCSANEFRRLGGRPDLLPLIELAGVATERWLQRRVLAAERMHGPEPSSRLDDVGGEVGEGEVEADGRRRIARG